MRILSSFFLFVILLIASCTNDDDTTNPGTNPDNETTGQLELNFTDAPIDNAEVSSCFVTISEVRVDGNKVEGFQKTSVDLLAYQNGEVFNAGSFDVATGSYGNIELVFDYDQDVNGNSPGCYIVKADGTKDQLFSSNTLVSLNHNTVIETSQKTSVVADFDLRKSVYIKNENGSESDYELVSETDLSNAVRVVNNNEVGVFQGSVSGATSSDGVTVAYIYERGSFNESTELSGQGSGNLRFQNSVSSALADSEGNFELHFLNEGDYDLYFASYSRDENNRLSFQGVFSINAILNQLAPVEVSINAKATTTMNISLSGLISL